MSFVVRLVCSGTDVRPHPARPVAEFYDKFATSWELTPRFGSGYGSERKVLRVPDAEPGDDTRMRVVITCPDARCSVRQPVRWENLHAQLDGARDRGWSSIPLKLLAD